MKSFIQHRLDHESDLQMKFNPWTSPSQIC